jgi:glutaredoxin 3
MDIKIYTTPTCGYCHQAKRYLTDRGISYKEYDVSVNHSAAGEMVQLTGQTGVPVIVVDKEVIIGFNRQRLEQLISSSTGSGKISLGLRVADASGMLRKIGSPRVSGAYIGSIKPDSASDMAGLKAGDIITSFSMKTVETAADIEKIARSLKPGDVVPITFLRGGESIPTYLNL